MWLSINSEDEDGATVARSSGGPTRARNGRMKEKEMFGSKQVSTVLTSTAYAALLFSVALVVVQTVGPVAA